MRFLQSILVLALFFGWIYSPRVFGESPLVEKYKQLNRSTRYRLLEKIPLKFNTYHPQGMVEMKDYFILSSVQVLDRKNEIGKGYLFKVNYQGEQVEQIVVGEGAKYHPGGIDFDGLKIWVSVAEYKPDSSSVVYTVNPDSMKKKEVFRFDDHLGAIVHDATNRALHGVSWGSRRWYTWKTNDKGLVINPQKPAVKKNPNHYIDYQDMQWIRGTSYMFMGGLAGYRSSSKAGSSHSVGGIDLWDTASEKSIWLNPIPLWTDQGKSMNQNPFYVQLRGKDLIIDFIPEDNQSTLYRYKALVR
jgi:hypothetical protein